eukprot:m.76501 g.76501  ORF g.76501 m.76501 type:complete len:51 (-) comp12486_c0_seq7:2643-2795(-)
MDFVWSNCYEAMLVVTMHAPAPLRIGWLEERTVPMVYANERYIARVYRHP